jgi:hypothetical protein
LKERKTKDSRGRKVGYRWPERGAVQLKRRLWEAVSDAVVTKKDAWTGRQTRPDGKFARASSVAHPPSSSVLSDIGNPACLASHPQLGPSNHKSQGVNDRLSAKCLRPLTGSSWAQPRFIQCAPSRGRVFTSQDANGFSLKARPHHSPPTHACVSLTSSGFSVPVGLFPSGHLEGTSVPP